MHDRATQKHTQKKQAAFLNTKFTSKGKRKHIYKSITNRMAANTDNESKTDEQYEKRIEILSMNVQNGATEKSTTDKFPPVKIRLT